MQRATTSMTTPDDALAFRVRDALLDEEEKPYLIWSESGPKPLKLNLDLLNHRARVLERRRDIDGALAALPDRELLAALQGGP